MASDSLLAGNTDGLSLATTDAHLRLVSSYSTGCFSHVYADLKGLGAEGIVLKRRRAVYAKQVRPGVEGRDWLKRRFEWE